MTDIKGGAFHTQKLSGSVTLDSISPSITIVKANYSHSAGIKTEETCFNHVFTSVIDSTLLMPQYCMYYLDVHETMFPETQTLYVVQTFRFTVLI